MLICGIDPGLGMTGVAVFDDVREEFVDVLAVTADKNMPHEDRIAYIWYDIKQLVIDEYGFDCLAIENNHITSGRSAQSALRQRELIGYIAVSVGMDVIRIAPATAKKVFTGSGKATKDQMVEVARRYVDLDGYNKEQREAIADAMGVAMAGAEAAKKEAA